MSSQPTIVFLYSPQTTTLSSSLRTTAVSYLSQSNTADLSIPTTAVKYDCFLNSTKKTALFFFSTERERSCFLFHSKQQQFFTSHLERTFVFLSKNVSPDNNRYCIYPQTPANFISPGQMLSFPFSTDKKCCITLNISKTVEDK